MYVTGEMFSFNSGIARFLGFNRVRARGNSFSRCRVQLRDVQLPFLKFITCLDSCDCFDFLALLLTIYDLVIQRVFCLLYLHTEKRAGKRCCVAVLLFSNHCLEGVRL